MAQTGRRTRIDALRIIELDHVTDVVWNLDGVVFPFPQKCRDTYERTPEVPEDPRAEREYQLVLLDDDLQPVEEKFISRGTAETLAGRTVGRMRQGARNQLRAELKRTAHYLAEARNG